MMLLLWVVALLGSTLAIFAAGWVHLARFWEHFELLAATAAATYAVLGSFAFFVRRAHGYTLDESIASPTAKARILLFRHVVPALGFTLVAILLVTHPSTPDEVLTRTHVRTKLCSVLVAMMSLLYGELEVQSAVRGTRASAPAPAREHWARESGLAVWFLYTGLTLCYVAMLALYNSAWLRSHGDEQFIQAFFGGVSALEIFTQGVGHAMLSLRRH